MGLTGYGGIGIETLPQKTGRPIRALAGGYGIWVPIGIDMAWGLVTANAGAEVDLNDGTPVYTGERAIEYGTVMVPVTQGQIKTVTIDAAGGAFSITVVANGVSRTTVPLAWNTPASTVQAAIAALSNVGEGRVTVTLSSLVYTITFAAVLGVVAVTTTVTGTGTTLTGGASTAAVGNTTTGSAYGGMWAPFDSNQSDGRQTLTRGSVGILDMSIKDSALIGTARYTDNIGILVGGLVWRERLKVGGSGQPTLANLLTAMPLLEITPGQ